MEFSGKSPPLCHVVFPVKPPPCHLPHPRHLPVEHPSPGGSRGQPISWSSWMRLAIAMAGRNCRPPPAPPPCAVIYGKTSRWPLCLSLMNSGKRCTCGHIQGAFLASDSLRKTASRFIEEDGQQHNYQTSSFPSPLATGRCHRDT